MNPTESCCSKVALVAHLFETRSAAISFLKKIDQAAQAQSAVILHLENLQALQICRCLADIASPTN